MLDICRISVKALIALSMSGALHTQTKVSFSTISYTILFYNCIRGVLYSGGIQFIAPEYWSVIFVSKSTEIMSLSVEFFK